MKEEKISIQEISSLFHLPLHQACIKLGRSKEDLNKICRSYGKTGMHFLTKFFSRNLKVAILSP
jgi:hypothetical protein